MTDVFIQYDHARKLLACGFINPGVTFRAGEWDGVFTVIVSDVPDKTSFGHVADMFLATKISPPRFWVAFPDLGPNREISGQSLAIEEAASISGHTANGLKSAISTGKLPTFRDPSPGRGQRGHMINSGDLEIYLATARRKPGPVPKSKPNAATEPKKRGRPRKG